jgi:DNA replication initiation complex subunit (GINS family)
VMKAAGGTRRSPLVVLSEASFPDRFSAPWSRTSRASETSHAAADDDEDERKKTNGKNEDPGAVVVVSTNVTGDGREAGLSPPGVSLDWARGP